jgi:2'-5' RNA ligase
MNAEQFISLADSLRDRALNSGADVNASNYLAHATLMRALREQPMHEIEHEKLASAVETAKARLT